MSAERKKIVKRLDDIFSKYIRERDKHRCVICGATNDTHIIQCGHIFSRVSYGTRWDEDNAFAMCAGDNLKAEFNFVPLLRYAEKFHGRDKVDLIYAKWSKSTKFSDSDLKQLIEYYKNKLQDLRRHNEDLRH